MEISLNLKENPERSIMLELHNTMEVEVFLDTFFKECDYKYKLCNPRVLASEYGVESASYSTHILGDFFRALIEYNPPIRIICWYDNAYMLKPARRTPTTLAVHSIWNFDKDVKTCLVWLSEYILNEQRLNDPDYAIQIDPKRYSDTPEKAMLTEHLLNIISPTEAQLNKLQNMGADPYFIKNTSTKPTVITSNTFKRSGLKSYKITDVLTIKDTMKVVRTCTPELGKTYFAYGAFNNEKPSIFPCVYTKEENTVGVKLIAEGGNFLPSESFKCLSFLCQSEIN